MKSASIGLILSDSILNQSILTPFWKIDKDDSIEEVKELHIIRDTVILNELFVSQITRKTLQTTIRKLIISGRQIFVTEPITFDNLELLFVADNFQGNDHCITVLPEQRKETELGQPGFKGKDVSIFAKKIAGVSVNLKGGNGALGQRGADGANATPPPPHPLTAQFIPGSQGMKGHQGGRAGDGGNVILKSLISISYKPENINIEPGSPGKGGVGGDGGLYRKAKVVKIASDCTGRPEDCHVTESDLWPSRRGPIGETGSDGKVLKDIQDKDQWWTIASKCSPHWSDYRTVVGEYYFRAMNNPDLNSIPDSKLSSSIIGLSLSELNCAIQLNPSNLLAKTLIKRILLLHTPLGQSRFVDLVPEFVKYRNNYTSFFTIVSEVRKIAQDYANLAIHKSDIQEILSSEITTIRALKQNIEHNLEKKIKPIKTQKINDINERVKEDKKISDLIEEKKKEIENQSFSIEGFFATVGVVVGVIGAAFTAGATLIASAQGLMAILKTGGDMIDAFDEIKSLGDVKTVIGEFIDVDKGKIKKEDSTHQKLIGSALDLKGAVNNFDKDTRSFKDNVEIVINIGKAISQINSSTTGNTELDSLLGQKAENMREILNAKKDLELLGYDEDVAKAQLETFATAAIQINDQIVSMKSDEAKFYLEFSIMVKRSQLYMNFLIEQVFFAIRSLEILKFEDYSNLIRYDIGYVSPDLEANLTDFHDESSAISLLLGFNNSFSNFSNIISLQNQYDDFTAPSNWNGYILRKEFSSSVIGDFVHDPRSAKLKFSISLDEIGISTMKYVIIQNVKMSFIGATTKKSGNEFNASLYQSGSVSQRVDDGESVNMVLEGREVNISDVRTSALSGDSLSSSVDHIGYDLSFGLSYRSVFGYYEVKVPVTEIIAAGLDFSKLEKIQIWFKLIYRK